MLNALSIARLAALRTAARRSLGPTLRAPYSRLAHASSKGGIAPLIPPRGVSILRLANAFQQQQKRGEASSVSGRPASQTPEQATQNIKEEIGNSATDLARTIAGGNFTRDTVQPGEETFLNVTSSVASSVPQPYIVFGLLGGVPYIFASATTCYLAYQAGLATSGAVTNLDPGVALTILDRALNIQVTYGAVMISFLGALHWGMEFAGLGGHKGYARLALGAAPVLYAWPTLALDPTTALIAQWVGFTSLWWADLKATGAGWTPKWYSQYRFYLSILVGSCIIATLGSTSFYGPVAGHGLLTHDLELIRAQRKHVVPEVEGRISGDVEAVPTGEEGDNYVQIRKRAAQDAEEGEKGKEGEE